MDKSISPLKYYTLSLLIICVLWVVAAIFTTQNIILPMFFICIMIAAFGIHHLEAKQQLSKFELLNKRFKRIESKAWYFESIIENSKDIIFTTDLEHRIIKFNSGSEDSFGLPALEVLGKDVRSLFDNPEEITKMVEDVKEKGVAKAVELSIRNKKSGENIWLSVTVSSLINKEKGEDQIHHQNKQFLGDIFNCKNITHRRLLEKELKEKNEQLTKLSITDSLTNLYNVRHLKIEATKLQKNSQPVSRKTSFTGTYRCG